MAIANDEGFTNLGLFWKDSNYVFHINYYHFETLDPTLDIEEHDYAYNISMLEEIKEDDNPYFFQWYLKGTLEWTYIVIGKLELFDAFGKSYYDEPETLSFDYGGISE